MRTDSCARSNSLPKLRVMGDQMVQMAGKTMSRRLFSYYRIVLSSSRDENELEGGDT